MFNFIFPAIVGLVLCIPMTGAAQDCGCSDPAPCCVKTRKKFQIVKVQKEVCRLQRVCVTDECGCSRKKFVRVKKCVTRRKLTCVEVPVDPCKKRCFANLGSRLKSRGCCEPDPCCDPAPCGCGG